jgi:hypothetical protein
LEFDNNAKKTEVLLSKLASTGSVSNDRYKIKPNMNLHNMGQFHRNKEIYYYSLLPNPHVSHPSFVKISSQKKV